MFKGLYNRFFIDNTAITSKDYHVSRGLFIIEGISSTSIFLLTSGAFLAGFAKYLGADDQFNGIIAAMPLLAASVQFFSPLLIEKMSKRKMLVVSLCLFYRLLLGFMVFIPLVVHGTMLRLTLLAGAYLLAYSSASFFGPAAGNWIVSLVPEGSRGKYFGKRDSYILAFTTVVSLVMGKILDVFRNNNDDYTGFLIVFSVVIVFSLLNSRLLFSIKEPPVKKGNLPLKIKNILSLPVKDLNFRKILWLSVIWNIAAQVALPYFAVYMVSDLRLGYAYMMFLNMLSAVASVSLVRLWGKLADSRSWVFTAKFSIGALAVCHSLWFFVNKDTFYILLPLLFVLAGTAWSGVNLSLFNIQFFYAPENGRTVYLGFNGAIGGLIGFVSVLGGSLIVGGFEGFKFNVLGVNIGNMQVVFGISGILLAGCVFFLHKFPGNSRVV
jgi:hypothetical protein